MKSRIFATLAATAWLCATPVHAVPTNPTVVSGSATFSQTGAALPVTNSNGAVINWNTFRIGAGETTRFVPNTPSSSVLNRVLSNGPSTIYGTLSSNGRVWLVNPAGIMVGSGRLVNVNVQVANLAALRAPPASQHAVPTAAIPPSPVISTTASANAGRMVDGAVTLRMPLVDTSAIAFH
jgi:filamentous hemagglutinin family protein